MVQRTTNTGFFKLEDDAQNWHHYYNANIDLLNNTALKLQGLADVDVKVLKDKSILKFNHATSKWDVVVKRGI